MTPSYLFAVTVVLYVLCPVLSLDILWNNALGNQGTKTIAAGETVNWIWTESRAHTVASTDGGFTSSGTFSAAGTTYSVTFNTVGSFGFVCSIHSTMSGTIQVVAATNSPTVSPTLGPTAAPTIRPTAAVGTPTAEPTTASPTNPPPTFNPTSRPTTSAPTFPSPTASPTSAPTYDVNKLLEKPLTNPVAISSGVNEASNWAITLKVRAYRHNNSAVAFTTRAYCYQESCSYPGPTIVVKPGDNLIVTLVNELGEESMVHTHNTMHSSNTTNLHTHGLHIDPAVDTVFVKAGPGESLQYEYQLQADHAPGLHWYHAHYHGSSTLQLMSGLAGALIVDPSASNEENIPSSILSTTSHLIVITRMMFVQEVSGGLVTQGCGSFFSCDAYSQSPLCTGTESTSPYNEFRLYTIEELNKQCGSDMDINPVFHSGSEADFDFVNGEYQPTLTVVKNSSTVLRVLHAAGGGPATITVSGDCKMYLFGTDGVYTDEKLELSTINIVAASRAEIELVCPDEGVYFMYNSGRTLMTLYVIENSIIKPLITDSELAAIIRPDYLEDLTDADVDLYYSVSMIQDARNSSECHFWMGMGSNCSNVEPFGSEVPSASSENCPFNYFEGERGLSPSGYLASKKAITFVGAVNEWTLYGMGSAFHPLHIHVNHFQIISSSSSAQSDAYYRPGQWRDTIPPVADSVVFRFKTSDYTGENVLHCHFQRHEDLGMMNTFLIMDQASYSALVISPVSSPTPDPTALRGSGTADTVDSTVFTAVLVSAIAGGVITGVLVFLYVYPKWGYSQILPTKG